ncbi:MAG: PH domain-containing protein, partial [Firmicutes bacterium]|nr:PH domain-containing protein [Candidatus Caballimonas caccae]
VLCKYNLFKGKNMGYVEKNVLQNDEKIIAKAELHKLKLVLAWIWGFLGFWIIFIPTIQAIKESIRFKTTEMYITDKKVVEKYGWLNTHCDEMNLEKIENITTSQNF